MLRDNADKLSFFVHPDLPSIVQTEDVAYIESLLQDLPERAKLHPGELFKQLSGLNVGPILTHAVGARLSDHPPLLELCSRFSQV